MTAGDRWGSEKPFHIEIAVTDAHIDRLNHVNNAVYLEFLEQAAWRHTEALGLNWDSYEALDAACVVRRHELDYLLPARRGDLLRIATWIAENDGRLAMWRAHRIRRVADGRTVLLGRTQYVCVRMANGRPRRMPQAFIDAYQPITDVDN